MFMSYLKSILAHVLSLVCGFILPVNAFSNYTTLQHTLHSYPFDALKIIARALGGKVEQNPLGWEVSAHSISFNEYGSMWCVVCS